MTAEFTPGQHIGDYEILSILGAGGMGKVYKVRNVISDRIEAMKILLPDLHSNQSLADRFLREIRLLATLSHPNIAALRTALTHENQLVMIMEFVEGETLSNRIARAPISTSEAVNYADQVLSALSYAHKQNIIHRDIKPANMMLTPQGVVKLMDFGIARSSTDGTLTSTGTTLGSLNYMPPEQVRGESADARSDIYSFGVSLYELLTGKLPFQSDSQYSLMTAHLNELPPAPITLRDDLPASLNEIILMAMAKDPAQRFQSADAFRAALKSVTVSALPISRTTVTPTPRPAATPKPSSATTLVETPLPPRVSTVAAPPRTPAPAPVPTQAVHRQSPGSSCCCCAVFWFGTRSVARSGRFVGRGRIDCSGRLYPASHGHACRPEQGGVPCELRTNANIGSRRLLPRHLLQTRQSHRQYRQFRCRATREASRWIPTGMSPWIRRRAASTWTQILVR